MQREGRVDWSCMGRVQGLWIWGESWVNRFQDPCVGSLFLTTDAIFFGWSIPLQVASGWKKAIAPPSGLPLTPSYRAYASWGFTCLDQHIEVWADSDQNWNSLSLFNFPVHSLRHSLWADLDCVPMSLCNPDFHSSLTFFCSMCRWQKAE